MGRKVGSKAATPGMASMGSWAALIGVAGGLVGASAAWAGNPVVPAGTGLAQVRHVCPAPTPGFATCFALVRTPVAAATPNAAGASPYLLDSGASSPGPAGGLTPAQLAGAYGYEPMASGAGQTVGIVDAFDDPEIEKDLEKFDAQYALPSCTTTNKCFEKVGQTGSTSVLPAADTTGWSSEISLDVETVHAVCPRCKILLVEGNSSSLADLATAENEAVTLGATEVSNGYGGREIGPKALERAAYDHQGVPIVVSTGDDGYYGWQHIDEFVLREGRLEFGESPEMPNTPASLPTVVAVGGTSLKLNADGTRASETVWNDNGPEDELGLRFGPQGATSGGCSRLFTAEPWQSHVSGFAATGCGTARLDADISAVGDPLTGFDIYDSYKCGTACEFQRVAGGWVTFGGTSLSAPIIASLYALAGGGAGVKYPTLTLYGHVAETSARFDVTSGANGYCGGESVALCGHPNALFGLVDCEGTTACNAAPGFDGPSGVGTPNGLRLFEPVLPTAVITPPASLAAGTPASFSAGESSDPYPGGSIASYAWKWGDNTVDGGGPSPVHAYATPGSYTVTLTITDNYGLTSASSTQSVKVSSHQEVVEEEAAAAKRKGEEEAAAAAKNTGGQGGVAGFQVSTTLLVPDAELASAALQASSSGAVSIKVSCPAAESSCSGTVTLRTSGAVIASAGSSAKVKARVLTLASGSFSVPGGAVKTVTLHLSAKGKALLARSHVLRIRATIVAHDPAGATHTTQTTVTLRAPKAKHGKR